MHYQINIIIIIFSIVKNGLISQITFFKINNKYKLINLKLGINLPFFFHYESNFSKRGFRKIAFKKRKFI